MLIHNEWKPHTCSKFKRMFKQQTHLRRHKKYCGTNNKVSFPNSPSVLLKGQELLSDSFECVRNCSENVDDSHDANNNYNNTCSIPNGRKQNLPTHTQAVDMKTKSKKEFKCNICSKLFSTKIALTNHTRTKSNKKELKCTICSKQFSRQRIYERHIMMHSGEKPDP